MMSINPRFNELKQAIEDKNLQSVKTLLTISVLKTIEDPNRTVEYPSQILSLQAFDTDLTATEIKALNILIPELLHNRINMEMAMLRAIEAEDLDFVNTLLEICASFQGWSLKRCPSFAGIIQRALAVDNDAIITAILACPHANIALAARINDRAHAKLHDLMNALLTTANGLEKNAKWFLYQLPFLLTTYSYFDLNASERIKIIQSPAIQAELSTASWEHSTYLLSLTTYHPFLNALLENPKIFRATLELHLKVVNQEHENWESLAKTELQPFSVLLDKIKHKIQNIPNASPADIDNYYRPLLDYYLQSKTKSSEQIQQLLRLEPLREQTIKFFRTCRTLILARHRQYPELLQNDSLLKHFFNSAFATLEDELAQIQVECPRIKLIQDAYQDKTDAPEIWDLLTKELPELKKDLVRLDESLGDFPEVKQLLKNLLHLVASLLTLGIYYYQRKRDLGQCFFKSPILEQQVKQQQTHLEFSPFF